MGSKLNQVHATAARIVARRSLRRACRSELRSVAQCLRRQNVRSISPEMAVSSKGRCDLRVGLFGITGTVPRSGRRRRSPRLSWAASAAKQAPGGTALIKSCRDRTSPRCPGVTSMAMGRPRASTMAWIFVARRRASDQSPGPPFPSAGERCALAAVLSMAWRPRFGRKLTRLAPRHTTASIRVVKRE